MDKREYSLDFIKIVATVLIIFHHYQQTVQVTFDGLNFYYGKFYFGYVVEMFFVLSGFFMYSYINKIKSGLMFREFYLRRFLRLFPVMAVGAVAYEIFLVIYEHMYQASWFGIKPTFWGTVISALGIQEGWALPNPFVNAPTWYISVLLLCYIVFYFLVWLSARRNLPVTYLFIFIIFLGMGIRTYGIQLPFLTEQSARGYIAFFFGVLLAGLLKDRKLPLAAEAACGVVAVLIPILIYGWNDLMADGMNYIMTFIYYPAVIILFRSRAFSFIFNRKWVGAVGKITFDVFIWHNPLFILMYILIKAFGWNVNLGTYQAMAIYAVVCFGVGAVSYFAIERPVARKIMAKW